jgi:inhibitor of KinA sporulation pathway (predicted exonuclease)
MNNADCYRKYDYYCVIDLEATCCDSGSIRRQDTEIIEVGAVLCDAYTLEPIDELQCFVKPERHPKLTRFCTELTSITQAQVDSGVSLAKALSLLGPWFARGDTLFCSWGEYDKTQFEIEARRNGLRLPFGRDHLNLKRAFSERRGESKQHGMAAALSLAGLPLSGTHHRGIDDARNIAKLLPLCVDPKRELSAP